jgi:hypothetical protein
MRRIALIGCLLAACAGHGAYSSRLWFRNVTTGFEGPSVVTATPGDVVSIMFNFHALDAKNPFKWGTLQITLCLDGLSLMSATDSDSWTDQLEVARKSSAHPSWFFSTIYHDSRNGPMYDFAIDPKNTAAPLVGTRGMYALWGVRESWDLTSELFRFTVQPGSEGEALNWCLDGRNTGTGLSTRLLDQKNATIDITDNTLVVVPEPSIMAGIACLAVLAVRRRKDV